MALTACQLLSIIKQTGTRPSSQLRRKRAFPQRQGSRVRSTICQVRLVNQKFCRSDKMCGPQHFWGGYSVPNCSNFFYCVSPHYASHRVWGQDSTSHTLKATRLHHSLRPLSALCYGLQVCVCTTEGRAELHSQRTQPTGWTVWLCLFMLSDIVAVKLTFYFSDSPLCSSQWRSSSSCTIYVTRPPQQPNCVYCKHQPTNPTHTQLCPNTFLLL